MREVRFDAGTTLVEEGSSAYELFVIEDGEVEVTKGAHRVRTLRAGDFFGEIGVLATDVAEKLRDAMRARVSDTAF